MNIAAPMCTGSTANVVQRTRHTFGPLADAFKVSHDGVLSLAIRKEAFFSRRRIFDDVMDGVFEHPAQGLTMKRRQNKDVSKSPNILQP